MRFLIAKGDPAGGLAALIRIEQAYLIFTRRQWAWQGCQQVLGVDDGIGLNLHAVKEWAGQLSKGWMESAPDLSGVLFIDGHVSLYFGEKTKLPKRYVSRLQLCMSGTSF